MQRHSTPIIAVALGAALALVAATPAAAAPYAGGIILNGDYTWSVELNTFAVEETDFNDGDFDPSDAWDGGNFAVWDDLGGSQLWHDMVCTDGDLSDADADGDRVVSCAVRETGHGLELDAQIRLFGEGDLARYLVTIENPTTAPIDFSWEFYVDFGETDAWATSSSAVLGQPDVVTSDLWLYNHEARTLNALVAWGLEGASGLNESVEHSGDDELYLWTDADDDNTQLTLAAGASITLAFFQKVDVAGTIAARGAAPASANDTDDELLEESSVDAEPLEPAFAGYPDITEEIAAATAEFSSFTGRLVRGLPSGLEVANWGTVSGAEGGSDDDSLAETGPADDVSLVAVLLALTAVSLGGVMVASSRRVRQTV